MKAIITGGGTGGHIYPALAVAKKLQKENWDILYIGSIGGIEGDIIPDEEIRYQEIDVAPFYRHLTPKLISSFWKTGKGFFQSRKIIKDFKPDFVLGTGGFVAGPVVLAGSLMKIPTIIHEQNVYPGLTNKILSRFVDIVALNFTDARKHFSNKVKAEFETTGNPIRKAIMTADRKESFARLNLDPEKMTVLVFGGSQGSASINKAMITIYKQFQHLDKLQIIHIAGKNNYDDYRKVMKKKGINVSEYENYKIIPYLKKMELAYAVSDLIVSRAGATGIAEITAKGIPAILIPYPHAAADHQAYNARALADKDAAVIIPDSKLDGKMLLEHINKLINNKDRLKEMAVSSRKLGKPDAVENIINLIKKAIV